MIMGEPSIGSPRRYDNRARQEKAAQTRERIVAAGGDLVRGFETWNWRDVTFKAVAERAGVGERTVYRHFPTERHLHDAVMQRLESEAGVSYEEVNLTNLAETTSRVFVSLQRFSVRESIPTPHDPAFVSSDQRRRDALLHAVFEAAPAASETHQRMIAGLLDVLWSPASYERLVGPWGLDGADATGAIEWLMATVVAAIDADGPPSA
jgi:AcrR family transcriptional regulator